MPFLTSSIPYFKAWVRRECTKNLEEYHGEFLHCMVIGVTTMPNRTLSFQVIFTGCESDHDGSPNINTVVQEVVNRPSWSSGNSINIVVYTPTNVNSSSAVRVGLGTKYGSEDHAAQLLITA